MSDFIDLFWLVVFAIRVVWFCVASFCFVCLDSWSFCVFLFGLVRFVLFDFLCFLFDLS